MDKNYSIGLGRSDTKLNNDNEKAYHSDESIATCSRAVILDDGFHKEIRNIVYKGEGLFGKKKIKGYGEIRYTKNNNLIKLTLVKNISRGPFVREDELLDEYADVFFVVDNDWRKNDGIDISLRFSWHKNTEKNYIEEFLEIENVRTKRIFIKKVVWEKRVINKPQGKFHFEF